MLENFLRSPQARQLMICLLIVIAPFFFLGGPDAYSSALFKTLWDCGHLCFFVVLVAFLRTVTNLGHWRAWLWLTLAVFVGGGLIELIQAHTGRDGNWGDLLRDLIGTWIALFWLLPPDKKIWTGRILATLLLSPTIYRVVMEAVLQLHNQTAFPCIADFESQIETYGHRSHLVRSQDYVSHGEFSLKLHLTTGRYSGITFDRLVNDWSGYRSLRFDIYNPGPDAFLMSVSVRDAQQEINGWKDNDRYNGAIPVSRGWNRVELPISDIQHGPAKRLMDLTHVANLVLFASYIPAERDIYLDYVRLER